MQPQDPFVGRAILDGQFTILQKVGSGSMGAVYKALETEMNRMVGVKILHSTLTDRKDLRSRFRREARATSQLTHPNTVRVFQFGELEDGSPYIVMEFLEGKNLNQTLRRDGPFPLARALPILIAACGALDEAHKLGIIHRDLKPENVFLVQSGGLKDFPKVLDFGIAKVGERQMRPGSIVLTQVGMVFGTPEFMSPEQAQGRSLTTASDIYSLAVILYEVLTGKLPYDAASTDDYAMLHMAGEPVPLSQRVPGLTFPPALDRLIDRALAKRPEDRFSSMEELGAALAAIPVAAPPTWDATEPVAGRPLADTQPIPTRDASWFGGERATADTMASGASPTELGQQRLGTIRPTNAAPLHRLKMAARMAVEADSDPSASGARAKRRASALETIQAIEKTLLARLDRASGREGVRAAWRALLPGGAPKKMAFGQLRLHQYLTAGDHPSLAVLARWVARGDELGPETLVTEIRQALGVPVGVEEDLASAGAVRIVLAHQAEYELDDADPLREAEGWVARIATEHGVELDVPGETLDRLAWVSACVMERRLRPRP